MKKTPYMIIYVTHNFREITRRFDDFNAAFAFASKLDEMIPTGHCKGYRLWCV